LPVITLVLELFLLVESPYWLMMRGRVADARKAIRFMYPKVSEEEIEMTCAQLAYTLEKEAEEAQLVRVISLARFQYTYRFCPTEQANDVSRLFQGRRLEVSSDPDIELPRTRLMHSR
jgi:hypothetical protein